MYTIELSDGTKLEGLGLNGNNFVSDAPVDEGIFEDKLDQVTITGPDGTAEHQDMKLIHCKQYGDEWWFVLVEKTKEEKDREMILNLMADLTEVVLLGGAK